MLSRQADIDQLRVKVTELESHIASQANFNPALMQQQIDELQISVSIYERQVQNLNAKHDVSRGRGDSKAPTIFIEPFFPKA